MASGSVLEVTDVRVMAHAKAKRTVSRFEMRVMAWLLRCVDD